MTLPVHSGRFAYCPAQQCYRRIFRIPLEPRSAALYLSMSSSAVGR